jgi:putative hydrolase of the HAD superfamily
MVKAIIFDCFGVLANDIWLAFIDSLPEGADIAQAALLNRTYDAGIINKTEFDSGMVEAVGSVPFLLEDAKPGQMVKNAQLLELISELKTSYKIGMLSNIYSNWIRTDFLSETEIALFNDMVFSFEVGTVKPDPEMFLIACNRLGVTPAEALMVDDREHNILAARTVGMQGITYTNFQVFKSELNTLLNTNY